MWPYCFFSIPLSVYLVHANRIQVEFENVYPMYPMHIRQRQVSFLLDNFFSWFRAHSDELYTCFWGILGSLYTSLRLEKQHWIHILVKPCLTSFHSFRRYSQPIYHPVAPSLCPSILVRAAILQTTEWHATCDSRKKRDRRAESIAAETAPASFTYYFEQSELHHQSLINAATEQHCLFFLSLAASSRRPRSSRHPNTHWQPVQRVLRAELPKHADTVPHSNARMIYAASRK